MPGSNPPSMAALAVGQADVAKGHLVPTGCLMTVAAIARKMITGCLVTLGAVV